MDNMENNILLDITTEISGNLPIHDYTKSSTDTELPYVTNDSVLLTDRSTFENTLVCDHPSILDSRNSFFDTLQNNRESVSTDSENISKQSSKKVLGKTLNEFVVPSNEFSLIFENDIINVCLSEDEEKKMNEYPGNCGSRDHKANNKKPVRRPFQMKSANNSAPNSTTISQETSEQNVTLNKLKRIFMESGTSNCSSSSKKIVYSSYSESNAIFLKSEQNTTEDLYRHDFEPPIFFIDNMSCSTSIPINSVNIKSDPSSSLQDMVNKIPVTSYDELQKCYETNDSNKTTYDDEMDETLCHSSSIVVTEENNQKEIIDKNLTQKSNITSQHLVEPIVNEVEPIVNEVEPAVNEVEPVNEKAPPYNLRSSTSRKRSLSIVSKKIKTKRSPTIKINRSIKMNPKKLKVINIIDPELGISNCSSPSKKNVYSSYSESNAIFLKSEQNKIKEDLYRHDFEPPISSQHLVEPIVNEVEPIVNEVEPIVGEVEPIVNEVEPIVGEVEPAVNEVEPVNEKAPPYNLRSSTSRKRSLSIVSKVFKRKRSPIIKINRSIKMNPKKLKVINVIDPELYTYVGKDIRKPDFPLLDYWCNPTLYNYLAEIMKIKHGIKTNRKVADLVKKMYVEVTEAMNKNSNFSNNVKNVKKMLWENDIILTPWDFHQFVSKYTPVCFQVRVIPSFSAPFDEVKFDVVSYYVPLTKESFK